ncbi:MAG TPA: RNA polymerase sigma factor [Bacteroidales bacterium]|nr:RNA polymerase sigma factor [Bacteroidales bacterium]
MTDNEKLIKQCQKKSSKAFNELYKNYASLVYGICLRYTKDKAEAEDLMQECFIKLLSKIGEYEFKGSFEGWLRRLTVNNAINYIRSKKVNILSEDVSEYEMSNHEMDSNVISKMSAGEIVNVINQLPDGYRMVFNLHVIEGYKHTEIAELLGISDITCRTQYKKAREALMALIKKNNE